jgi:hypothetical protein
MTTAEDLRELRDALDSIYHGALPRWGKPTTRLGEQAQTMAVEIYRKYVNARLMEGSAQAAVKESVLKVDQHRTVNEMLTARCEVAEETIEKLREENSHMRTERDAARYAFVKVAEALGLVSTDDTGRIGDVAPLECVIAVARSANAALSRGKKCCIWVTINSKSTQS